MSDITDPFIDVCEKLEEQNAKLREINAELLAALKLAEEYVPRFEVAEHQQIIVAIAKAEGSPAP